MKFNVKEVSVNEVQIDLKPGDNTVVKLAPKSFKELKIKRIVENKRQTYIVFENNTWRPLRTYNSTWRKL